MKVNEVFHRDDIFLLSFVMQQRFSKNFTMQSIIYHVVMYPVLSLQYSPTNTKYFFHGQIAAEESKAIRLNFELHNKHFSLNF